MPNSFGTDILIQAPDPQGAAEFYVRELGFTIDEPKPGMIGLLGPNINLYIEPGPAFGPVFEITVPDVDEATERLTKAGCKVIKDEPEVPRRYVQDPFGLIYNLTT